MEFQIAIFLSTHALVDDSEQQWKVSSLLSACKDTFEEVDDSVRFEYLCDTLPAPRVVSADKKSEALKPCINGPYRANG